MHQPAIVTAVAKAEHIGNEEAKDIQFEQGRNSAESRKRMQYRCRQSSSQTTHGEVDKAGQDLLPDANVRLAVWSRTPKHLRNKQIHE
jgi:hypothetical protein